MTSPVDVLFEDQSYSAGTSVSTDDLTPVLQTPEADKYPPPIIDISDDDKERFLCWLDEWIETLVSDQASKQREFADLEEAYRAKPGPKLDKPYIGASNETVPAIAMAVDPIHARLETGIFKQDPVIRLKPLKKSFAKYAKALEEFIEYYQKHKLKLRRVSSPRLLEACKLGTCVFKTVYDRQVARIKTYDKQWKVISKEEVRFSGPRVFGVSIGDFLFPPLYQDVQDCPIVVERIRTTFSKLKVAEASKKLANVDRLQGQETHVRTQLETAHVEASNHDTTRRYSDDLEVFEVWCDYDINGDGLPEHLVATYHKETRTLLQLRYNWYFHQRKPYTVIPYSVTNDSLYGFGLAEMVKPFQDALTKWHRMATDNAYLANIRMFIVKKGSGIEEIPRLYGGRCFFVDDPKSDFIPFAGSDIYPSTLTERQNMFGLIEKRTGVSDYLTGRESPIIGTRATATSTVALIQEGTRRVEQVMENLRAGFAEIIENCIYIWIQYGLDGLDEVVFSGDETADLLRQFFGGEVSAENVNGALAISLSATDASNNKQAMQQMQLQIIQLMMGYLEKVLAAGQAALQMQQTMPVMAQMIADVAKAARNMFSDLLQRYDVPNPDDYLVDLEKYLNGTAQPAVGYGAGDSAGPAPGIGDTPSFSAGTRTPTGPTVPQPATPGAAIGPGRGFPLPGVGGGIL
jgi:hypothetical protein